MSTRDQLISMISEMDRIEKVASEKTAFMQFLRGAIGQSLTGKGAKLLGGKATDVAKGVLFAKKNPLLMRAGIGAATGVVGAEAAGSDMSTTRAALLGAGAGLATSKMNFSSIGKSIGKAGRGAKTVAKTVATAAPAAAAKATAGVSAAAAAAPQAIKAAPTAAGAAISRIGNATGRALAPMKKFVPTMLQRTSAQSGAFGKNTPAARAISRVNNSKYLKTRRIATAGVIGAGAAGVGAAGYAAMNSGG